MKPRIQPLAGILAALTTSVISVIAATGTLDATFGTGGTSLISFGATEVATAVAVAPDGKIVVVGSTDAAGNSDIAVLRYNANGTLDNTFSSDGGTTTDIGTPAGAPSADFATAVAVQADGKILVSGYTNANTANDFVTVRYNVDGSIDSFFGSAGRTITNLGTNDRASSIALQADGKIVVGGSFDDGSSDFAVVRYNANGTPDTSFSGDGLVVRTVGGQDFCQAVAIQADGKIVLAGYSSAPGSNDFAVLRFTAVGVLDTTFDTDGILTTSFGDDDRANSVVIQPDGAIVVAGSFDGGASDFAIARYSGVNGALDTTFSTDGKQNISFAPAGFGVAEFCQALALQSDGKLLLGGFTNESGNNDFGLVRLTSNGSLDTGFATGGKMMIDVSIGGSDQARAIALQADGKPVIAGNSLTDMAVIRLNTLAKTDARVGSGSSTPIGADVFNGTGSGQTLDIQVRNSGGKKTSFVRIDNKGHDTDSFTVGGTGGNSRFTVEYFAGTTNVTTAVTGGTFNTGSLAPGGSFLLKVRITTKTGAVNKKLTVLVTGTSVAEGTATDTVAIKAKSK